ncbi:N-acetyltransferase family protein [Tenacibaculum sp. UWU-22]|uniref:GNAT family N-acetyltransferase n=1 Tax=Tenacibaculum sp. UWU-22 TaxID=3234187 RepID=UPI0034DB793F
MSVLIREGKQQDMQAVLNLITELAVFEKEPSAVEITVNDLIEDGFSENPKFKIFVAEENNNIIGMALFYERYSTWKGKAIHLEDLIVTKNKRGIGVGKALYVAVLKFAHANGFNRVAWEVLNWNTNAIDFYKNTGAVVLDDWQVVHMTKKRLTEFIEKN